MEEKKETGMELKKERDEVQITVSLECERNLSALLDRVNHEFDLGRVSRKMLAVFILERVVREFSEEDVRAVRAAAITDISLLDRLYRETKSSGVVPDALREFLRQHMKIESSPKRSKKSGQSKYSNAISTDEDAA